jgi:hypothetical protein
MNHHHILSLSIIPCNRSSTKEIMTRASLAAFIAVAVTAWISFGHPAIAQEETDQRLGAVHFPISCNETAQRRFDRGMRYQHSFWYRESKEIFEEVLKADPECGIAYWAIALSYLNNPFSPPPAPNLPLGFAAIEKGKTVGAKTQRERDYIDALGVFYTDYDKVPHPVRVQAYLKATDVVAQRYPGDDEAQMYYGLALDVAALPTDKTYVNQLKAAAILEEIFKRQPQHPGVAHYLIHTYDYPLIAERGLDAARRYSKIAPAAAHAQHMPSHIFTRVGSWQDSIASNVAAARAAKVNKELDDQLHATDYLVYAYLQLAQDKKARELIDEMTAVTDFNPKFIAGPYALSVAPVRYMVERGDWKGAAELQVRPSEFANTDAIAYFARALGAARLGNPEAAKANITKLAELRDKLRDAKDAYWTEQVDIQWQVATAWLLYAEGKFDDALKTMSAAADAEDKTEKHVITPGVPRPARELMGEMLLERGMAAAALAAFEGTMRKEPNRFNAIAGAARAAERMGDKGKAKEYYQKLTTIASSADTVRPAIVAAREYLAKN